MATYAVNSPALFHIARPACDRCSAADTIVAVVFAALGLEAFVNEALDRSRFSATAPELAKRLVVVADAAGLYSPSARVRQKLQVLSAVLTGQKLDMQAEPYVDANLLIDVRNFLVHQWPEKLENDAGERVRQQLVDRLVERRAVHRPPQDVYEGTFGVLSEGTVGRWAFNSALAMVNAIGGMFPDAGWREMILLAYRRLAPVT